MHLKVDRVSAAYGGLEVLDAVTLDVESATTTAILGASGGGKTTLLRAIAGFVRPTAGVITLGDRTFSSDDTWVAPERRRVGYVAQEGNLFPHLSVADNITFGLPRRDRRQRSRVAELLELVGLSEDYAHRRPEQLSGGQQQRIALARALAVNPQLILLDEPFSALDVALRESTRAAISAALRETSSTVVLVTHDQREALSFADRVAVMRDGRCVDAAHPIDLYRRPSDVETARFVGDTDVVEGTVTGATVRTQLGTLELANDCADGAATVVIRPEQVHLEPAAAGASEELTAIVDDVAFFGADALVTVLAAGGLRLRARVRSTEIPQRGGTVRLRVDGHVLSYPHVTP